MARVTNNRGEKSVWLHQERPGFLTRIAIFLNCNRIGELLLMKGLIDITDLQFALSEHRRTSQPVGQVLLVHNLISRRQLANVLAKQNVLRFTAAALMCLMTFSSFGSKRARAEIIRDVPASISFNVASGAYEKMNAYPGLFGTAEKRSGDLNAFTKWSGMFGKFESQLKTDSGQQTIDAMKVRLADYKDLPLKSMAARVNTMMNEKPYILDNKNWGKSDYWETPIEFLKRGGDCEDFAIAKYSALRTLGVPEERMRVVIVQDLVKNIPHAVLVVYTDEGPYILDNQNKSLVDASDAGRYKPIFSINRTAWWLHTTGGTQIASR